METTALTPLDLTGAVTGPMENLRAGGMFGGMASPGAIAGASGTSSPAGYGTILDFDLDGKARPNRPGQGVLDMLGYAAEDVFGQGARVVVFSGQENEGDQHGSNRHRTGLAADVRVYAPDGTLVRLDDPRAGDFMEAAARRGALGIGAGQEYMGDAFHIDMVPHENYGPGQGPAWGSLGNEMETALTAQMRG